MKFGFLFVAGFCLTLTASLLVLSRALSHSAAAVVDMRGMRWEVVDTDEGRERGLSGREKMGDGDGMLFVFPKRGLYPFWMKDMSFDLDIVWLDGETVVDVATLPRSIQADGSRAAWVSRHVPLRLADRVLEMKAGLARAYHLGRGTRVILP